MSKKLSLTHFKENLGNKVNRQIKKRNTADGLIKIRIKEVFRDEAMSERSKLKRGKIVNCVKRKVIVAMLEYESFGGKMMYQEPSYIIQ